MAPATTNGIGTLIFGNCGCGFAPCVKEDRNFLIELMVRQGTPFCLRRPLADCDGCEQEGVEDIPKAALEEGMGAWGWETFPEWLDYADTLETACDFGALIAHGAIRTYVMGERGADHEEETSEADLQAMHDVVKQAVEAGAMGFATNRETGHQDMSGNPVRRHTPPSPRTAASGGGTLSTSPLSPLPSHPSPLPEGTGDFREGRRDDQDRGGRARCGRRHVRGRFRLHLRHEHDALGVGPDGEVLRGREC